MDRLILTFFILFFELTYTTNVMLIPPDANVILYSVLGITSIGLWKGKKMIRPIKIRAIKKINEKKTRAKFSKITILNS